LTELKIEQLITKVAEAGRNLHSAWLAGIVSRNVIAEARCALYQRRACPVSINIVEARCV
jgi:hypothetical protein